MFSETEKTFGKTSGSEMDEMVRGGDSGSVGGVDMKCRPFSETERALLSRNLTAR